MHIKELFSLKGKVALVTGGAGLYGQCIVEALAEAGANVITASRNIKNGQMLVEKFKERGLYISALVVDQADIDSVENLKKELINKFGRLDIFINNAVARPMKRYEDPITAWAESMEINATGMFNILREMISLIEKSGGGTIVNIGSMQGMFGPDFSLYEGTTIDSPPDYHFHKGGMISLTKYLARKLGGKNIRVNCISPGGLNISEEENTFIKAYKKKTPLGRMAKFDDLKGGVVFLASDASSYITGENILMDGGLHA